MKGTNMGIKVVIRRASGGLAEETNSHPDATEASIDSGGNLLLGKINSSGFRETVAGYAPGKWESFVEED
jgi:hypothetical protein